jgi:2-succinyl-6-hydroxy-2,4-cyclohexadiene-1-carboxylate synthase
MIFELAGIKLNISFFHTVENDKPCLLFLHGFTGSTDDWNPLVNHIDKNFSSIGIDIIGHGGSDSPDYPELYTADAITIQVKNIVEITTKGKVIPVGYSMGGRAALHFALRYPEMIEALILESTTPGIKDEKLREDRIKKDEEIVAFIESHTMGEFIDYWMNKDIFNTQRRFSEEKRREIKKLKLSNNKIGLVNSLRGFGTGAMPPMFDQLKNIKCKTLLITGDLDTKFTNINSEMIRLFPHAEHKIIKNAGHNTHLEEPQKFVEVVNEFLSHI